MFESAPFPPTMFYAHLLLGAIGLGTAIIALSATKGGVLHIRAGRIMVACMTISAVTALIFMMYKFSVPPVVNSVLALYGLLAGFLALRNHTPTVKIFEILLSIGLLITFSWFLIQAIPNVYNGTVPLFGPASIGIIAVIFLSGDLYYYFNLEKRQRLRVQRHATRMIWAFVVLIRAPLFELREHLDLSLPVVILAPLLVGVLLQLTFWKKVRQLTN